MSTIPTSSGNFEGEPSIAVAVPWTLLPDSDARKSRKIVREETFHREFDPSSFACLLPAPSTVGSCLFRQRKRKTSNNRSHSPTEAAPKVRHLSAALTQIAGSILHQRTTSTGLFPLASTCNCKEPHTLSRNDSPFHFVLMPHIQFPQSHKHSRRRYLSSSPPHNLILSNIDA